VHKTYDIIYQIDWEIKERNEEFGEKTSIFFYEQNIYDLNMIFKNIKEMVNMINWLVSKINLISQLILENRTWNAEFNDLKWITHNLQC
jgi:hypothetical protein